MESKGMRRRLIASILIWFTALAIWAEAGDWMFRRSYYSHDAGPGDLDDSAPSRSAYRAPWVGAHPHSAVRSGWRYNSFVINNGSSTDMTFYRENWYDTNY
jgi:hypothetical protein